MEENIDNASSKRLNPNNFDDVLSVADIIRHRFILGEKPDIGIILGTGFNDLARNIRNTNNVLYSEIPGMQRPTVNGHEGNIVFGELKGKQVVAMQGRIHPYEGFPISTCAFPIRVMKELGITTLLLTSAVGGLNQDFSVGDLVIIKDHIFLPGLSGLSPLYGPNDERIGPRFPTMNNTYEKTLRNLTKKVAVEQGLQGIIKEGIYVMVSGPQFETPAEVRYLKSIGADVVGMSVCHEAVVARHCGLRVLGISLVTNMCESETEHTSVNELHEEVLDIGKQSTMKICKLIKGVFAQME